MPASQASHHDPAIDAYVRAQAGEQRETCTMLVDLIRRNVPGHTEKIHRTVPWFWVDGRPFCYVMAYDDHVNLGFRYGAQLADPDGLLEGTGASMRHVKIIGPKAAPKAKLVKLVKKAAALKAP